MEASETTKRPKFTRRSIKRKVYRDRLLRDQARPLADQKPRQNRTAEVELFKLTELITVRRRDGIHVSVQRDWSKMYGSCQTLCRGSAYNTDDHKKWQKDLLLGCRMFTSDGSTLEKMTVASCLHRAIAMKFYEIKDFTLEIEESGRTWAMQGHFNAGVELLASKSAHKAVNLSLLK
jgi:hypothetical protein